MDLRSGGRDGQEEKKESLNIISGANETMTGKLEGEVSISSRAALFTSEKDNILEHENRREYNEGTHLFTSEKEYLSWGIGRRRARLYRYGMVNRGKCEYEMRVFRGMLM
jgi:hypothetical protein